MFSGDSEGLPGVNVDRYGDFVVVHWLTAGALALARRALRRHRGEPAARRDLRAAAPATAGWHGAPRAGGACPRRGSSPGDCRRGGGLPLRRRRDRAAGRGLLPRPARRPRRRRCARRRSPGAQPVLVHRRLLGAGRGRRRARWSRSTPWQRRTRGPAATSSSAACRPPGSRPSPRTPARRWTGSPSIGRRFDLVVCDPPTFSHAQGAGAPFSVTRNLGHLAAACLRVLEPGGLLAFSTNASKLSGADVERALAEGATEARCPAGHRRTRGVCPRTTRSHPGSPRGTT